MKRYTAFSKLQHYLSLTIRLFDFIYRKLIVRSLTPLQRCSRCIIQPQPTGLSIQDTRWEILPSTEMQSVYSVAPIDLAVKSRTLTGGFYPSTEMQSVYSVAPTDLAVKSRTLTGGFYPSTEMQSMYSEPSRLGLQNTSTASL